MKNIIIPAALLVVLHVTVSFSLADQHIPAMHVAEPPVIDGIAEDTVWKNAQEIITRDIIAKLPITLKAVYTDKEIFLLVQFPDPDESKNHKSWVWNSSREIYTVGYDREDIFTIKWNMSAEPVDLSIYADNSYQADIWYWKARRTDTIGYADDKNHTLSSTDEEHSTKIISRSGKPMFLLRNGDDGNSAYRVNLITDYQGDILPRYIPQQPSGSRSDVRAKGNWQNGTWTIEFRRDLKTDNSDDIQFSTGNKYLFGISRYEIAGRKKNRNLSDPLYGTGDVNEPLWLEFKENN